MSLCVFVYFYSSHIEGDISSRHVVGLYWVPGHAEIADELAMGGSALRFLAPEPTLGVSRRDLQKKARSPVG